jgi:hypothetical protein
MPPGQGMARPPAPAASAQTAARLRAQTRKQLGKHYRAKFGVR